MAQEFPQIETESLLVDRAVMEFVRRPESFDVVVASNLFGDILTDLGAAIAGSMGIAPSANLDPSRTNPSLFQAIHGSAPDIAGQGIANPLALIMSGVMMLNHLGERASADRIKAAYDDVLAEGNPDELTRDIGGRAGTKAFTKALLKRMA